MKKSTIIIVGVLIVAIVLFLTWPTKDVDTDVSTSSPATTSVEGCYVATSAAHDLYSLDVQSQNGTTASGTLAFNNAEKDSSKGTFTGTYQNGILLADYTFQSEGTTSVMQVIFKKSGDDFVRGYGDLNADGTRFADTNAITYDATAPLSLFKNTPCTAATSPAAASSTVSISYPKGGEKLIAGQTYPLAWTGGADTIQISLIDTSLESAGASVSVADSVYGLKNTGMYQYTVPKTLKPGVYKLQIGNSTSNTFTVAAK